MVAKWDGLYAEALRTACKRAFPATPIEVCRQGTAVLTTLRAQPANLALLGLTFADMDGLDVLQAIARERLASRVLVVSGRRDEHSLQALRTTRFDGFFDPLGEDIAALIVALRRVAEGQGYISPWLLRPLMGTQPIGPLGLHLSPAELQVLCVIGDGSENAEAAERLGLAESTVRTYRRNIMRKLDVPTSAKLVREAVRLGVVRITPDGKTIRPGFERLQADWQARKAARQPPAADLPAD